MWLILGLHRSPCRTPFACTSGLGSFRPCLLKHLRFVWLPQATRLESERTKLVIQSQELQIWDMAREEELVLLRVRAYALHPLAGWCGSPVARGIAGCQRCAAGQARPSHAPPLPLHTLTPTLQAENEQLESRLLTLAERVSQVRKHTQLCAGVPRYCSSYRYVTFPLGCGMAIPVSQGI